MDKGVSKACARGLWNLRLMIAGAGLLAASMLAMAATDHSQDSSAQSMTASVSQSGGGAV